MSEHFIMQDRVSLGLVPRHRIWNNLELWIMVWCILTCVKVGSRDASLGFRWCRMEISGPKTCSRVTLNLPFCVGMWVCNYLVQGLPWFSSTNSWEATVLFFLIIFFMCNRPFWQQLLGQEIGQIQVFHLVQSVNMAAVKKVDSGLSSLTSLLI